MSLGGRRLDRIVGLAAVAAQLGCATHDGHPLRHVHHSSRIVPRHEVTASSSLSLDSSRADVGRGPTPSAYAPLAVPREFFGVLVEASVFQALTYRFGEPPDSGFLDEIDEVLAKRDLATDVRARWNGVKIEVPGAVAAAADGVAPSFGSHLKEQCDAIADARAQALEDRALELHLALWDELHAKSTALRDARAEIVASLVGRFVTSAWNFEPLFAEVRKLASPKVEVAARDAVGRLVLSRTEPVLGRTAYVDVDLEIARVTSGWLQIVSRCSPRTELASPKTKKTKPAKE